MSIAAGIIVGFPDTVANLPGAGWSRQTALDGKHPKQIPNSSTDPGTQGGSAQHHHSEGSHNHTIAHTHITGTNTAASSGTAQDTASGTPDAAQDAHVHSIGVVATPAAPNDVSGDGVNPDGSAITTDNKDNDPARWDTIWIESNGTPTIIPTGAILYWNNATLPPSWTQPANGKDKFLRGAAAAGDGGGTGGGTSHTHAGNHHHSSTHFHPSGTTGNGPNLSNSNTTTNNLVATDTHSHTYDVQSNNFGNSQDQPITTTGAATPEPPWIKLAIIQSPGAALVSGMIALWRGLLANIPTDWILCNGSNGTPNLCQGLFVKGCNLLSELLATGGTTTHGHTAGGTHTHTGWTATHTHGLTINATATFTGATGTAQTWAAAAHTHPNTVSGAASALTVGTADPSITDSVSGAHDPVNETVAYIQYAPAVAFLAGWANRATSGVLGTGVY